MTERRCCPECFGDRELRRNIIPALGAVRGACDFCGTQDVDLVEPRKLADVFELLVSVYEPSDSGKNLVEWMKDDWLLFRHPDMDNAHAKELLSEILDDGDVVRKSFVPSPAYQSQGLAQWQTLRDELMYTNRYFLNQALDADRLRDLLSRLIADGMGDSWYRARISADDEKIPIEKMGAPPARLVSHGRANPPGIPYLYLASQPNTAVAEIRPHTGELAHVANFVVPPPVVLVDLRNPRQLVSPFVLSEASEIGQLRADIPFLERLGEELTRPVLPQGAAIDYLPSQYLCEFIKKSGFDGVLYRSSVGEGINLALFDPAKATGKSVDLYQVHRVTVDTDKRSS